MEEPGYFRRAVEFCDRNASYVWGLICLTAVSGIVAGGIALIIQQEKKYEREHEAALKRVRQRLDQRKKLRTEYDGLLQDAETKADKNNNDILESSEISDLLEGTGCKFSLSKGAKAKIEWTEEEPGLKGTNTENPIIYLNVNDIRRYLGDNQLKKTG